MEELFVGLKLDLVKGYIYLDNDHNILLVVVDGMFVVEDNVVVFVDMDMDDLILIFFHHLFVFLVVKGISLGLCVVVDGDWMYLPVDVVVVVVVQSGNPFLIE